MVDIIRGASANPVSTKTLIEFIKNSEINEGILYTGYPIIGAIESKYSLDAILLSPEYGIIVFDVIEDVVMSERGDIRDELYNIVLQRLIGNKALTSKRGQLKANLEVLTFAPAWSVVQNDNPQVIINKENFDDFFSLNKQDDLSIDDYKKLLEAIQAISKLKQKPPRKVENEDSKGAILNFIEKSISNLDRQQSKAVIETVDGVQRIRGLAGSGKTVVLALKVAYLHSKFPDWTIGVTFYTRSLKKQFIELITKFTIEHKNEEPDWTKIKILQAWGSSKDSGIYYEFCRLNNVEYLDYNTAKYKYGAGSNFYRYFIHKGVVRSFNKQRNL